MAPTPRPLAVQRLLLAGLVALAALSMLLLWLLRSSAERGRGPGSSPAGAVEGSPLLAAPARTSNLERAFAPGPEPLEERSSLGTESASAEASKAETFDPGALSGRLVCRGVPVPEVELRLFAEALAHRERKTPLATTKSDGEGRFRVTGFQPHERLALHAQHPDYLPVDEFFFTGHEQELELERAATVSGTVRTFAGEKPIAGIEVALERWHFGPTGMRARISATSDAEGRWRLAWAEPGIQTFEVLRPGCLPERREFQVAPEGGEGYAILLGEERVLELELFALESGALLADTELAFDERPVRTDGRGRLGLPLAHGAPETTVRVSLALEGGCLTQGRVDPAALRAAGTTFLRVPLARGGTVRGRVLDAAEQPVGGAELRLGGGGRAPTGLVLPDGFWLNPRPQMARSGADGSFELGGLPPREGLVELRARHPDHPPGRSEPFAFARLGETVELEVRLERGATISGRVHLDGEPAALRVFWNGERASGWTRANDRGAYRIAGVPSGELRLGARLDDEDEDSERQEDLLLFAEEGASLTADLELVSRVARIRGRVLDTQGQPVAEADVWAILQAEEQDEDLHTESEPDGSFALAVPDTAGLVFDVLAVRGPCRVQANSVSAGQRDLELVMPALASVALRVVDALRHEPVQGFQLYWREAVEGSYERLVQGGRSLAPGPDGTFLAELPAARLDLLVSARALGYVPARREGVNLLAGGTPLVEFELETGVELELEFELAPEALPETIQALQQLKRGRTSIANEEQWAERERGGAYFHQEVRNAQALRPDASGVARLEALPSGRYRFFNGPKGFVFRPQEFELPPVAQQRVKVTLEPEKKKKKQQKQGGSGN